MYFPHKVGASTLHALRDLKESIRVASKATNGDSLVEKVKGRLVSWLVVGFCCCLAAEVEDVDGGGWHLLGCS
jgi:hypothetical protein